MLKTPEEINDKADEYAFGDFKDGDTFGPITTKQRDAFAAGAIWMQQELLKAAEMVDVDAVLKKHREIGQVGYVLDAMREHSALCVAKALQDSHTSTFYGYKTTIEELKTELTAKEAKLIDVMEDRRNANNQCQIELNKAWAMRENQRVTIERYHEVFKKHFGIIGTCDADYLDKEIEELKSRFDKNKDAEHWLAIYKALEEINGKLSKKEG